MNVNWKVRIKNKLFWLALIPAMLLLIKAAAEVFGITLNFTELESSLIQVVEAVFLVLGIIGIVADPTTEGISDSIQALSYTEPKSKRE